MYIIWEFEPWLTDVSSTRRVTLEVLWCVRRLAGCSCSGWWAGATAAPRRTNPGFTPRSANTTTGSRRKPRSLQSPKDWCIPKNEAAPESHFSGFFIGSRVIKQSCQFTEDVWMFIILIYGNCLFLRCNSFFIMWRWKMCFNRIRRMYIYVIYHVFNFIYMSV